MIFSRKSFLFFLSLLQHIFFFCAEHGLKELCSALLQKLSEPDAAGSYPFEVLEQASNFILLEHTLFGCLLALKNEIPVSLFIANSSIYLILVTFGGLSTWHAGIVFFNLANSRL